MPHSAAAKALSAEYVWKSPAAPVRIHITLDVISQLRKHLHADRESGGLLVGSVDHNRVYITDFEASNFERGHSHFIASDAAGIRLQNAIAGRRGKTNTSAVVGYYRTDAGGGIRLTEQDLKLIDTCFPDRSDVFLVIRTAKDGSSTAGFFFHDGGSVVTDSTPLEFPFDERLLGSPREPEIISTGNLSVPAEPVQRLTAVTPATGVRRLPVRKAAFAIGILLAAFAAFRGATSRRSTAIATDTAAVPVMQRHVVSSPFSLWAAEQGDNVSITWDSQRPAISEARVGVLTVDAQGVKSEFPLTRTQLQSSKLLFPAKSSLLEITLEVFSPRGTSTRESIVLTAAQRSQHPAAQADAGSVRNRTSADTVEGKSVGSGTEARRRFLVAAPVSPSRTIASPVLLTEGAPTTQIAAALPSGLQTPDFLASSTTQPLAPKLSSNFPQRHGSMIVQPPTAIQEVKPVLTPTVLAMVRRPVSVRVKVSIDDAGNVVRVEASAPPGTLNQYLTEAATRAARMWRFEPARRGDTKLASESVLHFVFGPKQ
jgi:hypothetical protein